MFIPLQRLLIVLALSSLSAQAITTPEIAASALSPACVKYQVVGVCYCLYCTPFCKYPCNPRHYFRDKLHAQGSLEVERIHPQFKSLDQWGEFKMKTGIKLQR